MKTILALDGGGVRGLITLAILYKLEEYAGKPLYEFIDMVVGASIGSILAMAMITARRSAKEMWELCSHDAVSTIFSRSLWQRLSLKGYDGKGKRRMLDTWMPDVNLGDLCSEVRIPVFNYTTCEPCVFANSTHPQIHVRDACDASSAAPTYFPPVQIDSMWYGDGGVFANNPSMIAVTEGIRKWGKDNIRVLSIGTGHARTPIDGKDAAEWTTWGWYQHHILDVLMDSPMNMVTLECVTLLGDKYMRIDAPLETYHMPEVLDDVSEKTCDQLKKIGVDVFHTNKESLLSFLGIAQVSIDEQIERHWEALK